MTARLIPMLSLVACFGLEPKLVKAADGVPVEQSKRFDAIPGSKIAIEGRGGIHNWRAEGTLISGFIEVAAEFIDKQAQPKKGPVPARAEVFIPVRNIKGVGESWEPYNEQRTSAIHKELRADDYPRIVFRLKELVRTATNVSDGISNDFLSTGELVIAGVTNQISMPIQVVLLPGRKLKIFGRTEIRQSDFSLIPKPKVVFEYVDRDTLKVTVEWMVAQKEGT